MKVLVLGSGVIGVTTAWYLAQAGHEVEVVDRCPGPAMETSFANAGEISPGYASPWAGPGVPLKALRWLMMRHGPLVLRPKLDPAQWRWVLQMLANCTSGRYARNKARMVPLAQYSRDQLRLLRAQTGIAYDERSQGTLQLFRTERQLDGAAADMAVLDRFDVPYELLDKAGCLRAEPGLGRAHGRFVGGLRLPGDETGDCKMFTDQLAQLCVEAGVTFRYGTRIHALQTEGEQVGAVATSAGALRADAYVVALGSYSPLLLRPAGIRLPVYPVKGYSLTFQVADAGGAPVSTIMDETYKIAITRLGNRVRVGGTAELCGYDTRLHPSRRAALEHSVGDLFPTGIAPGQGDFWCGLRPMTPDGPPVIGPTGLSNLHLNTGHGTLGWTMACGSARILSDLLSQRVPEIDADQLSLAARRAPLPADPVQPVATRPQAG